MSTISRNFLTSSSKASKFLSEALLTVDKIARSIKTRIRSIAMLTLTGYIVGRLYCVVAQLFNNTATEHTENISFVEIISKSVIWDRKFPNIMAIKCSILLEFESCSFLISNTAKSFSDLQSEWKCLFLMHTTQDIKLSFIWPLADILLDIRCLCLVSSTPLKEWMTSSCILCGSIHTCLHTKHSQALYTVSALLWCDATKLHVHVQ